MYDKRHRLFDDLFAMGFSSENVLKSILSIIHKFPNNFYQNLSYFIKDFCTRGVEDVQQVKRQEKSLDYLNSFSPTYAELPIKIDR